MKKSGIFVTACILGTTCFSAYADDYQIEGGVSYEYISPDGGSNDSALAVGGTYYLDTVSPKSVLNEAAFLGRNSNIYAQYITIDKANVDGSTVGVEWWFNDIYAAGNINDLDGFGTQTFQLGYMTQQSTLFAFVYQTGDQPDDAFGVRGKYVGDLGNRTVNLEGKYLTASGDSLLELQGNVYFSNELSAGLQISDPDTAGAETQSVFSAKNFFTPLISGELDYVMNPFNTKGDAFVIKGAMRF